MIEFHADLEGLTHDAPVAVALSGGVDSAVTAALLREKGHTVIGLTLRLHDLPGSEETLRDAAQIAESLGLGHRVLDFRKAFARSVVEPFAESYAAGETPLPCARCNRFIKFGGLLPIARALGAQALATGHYVRQIMGKAGAEIHKAVDLRRDQSYFLFDLPRDDLSFLRFPLGSSPGKEAVRSLASQFSLPVASKSDSQDICFVEGNDYAALVRKWRPEAERPGDFVLEDGTVIGRHRGILHYTVGQRRGLDLGLRHGDHNEPLFVLRVEADRKRVVVGPREALKKRSVFLHGINWIASDVSAEDIAVSVRLRSTQQPVSARWQRISENPEDQTPKGEARLILDEPVLGVAPGQAGVAYDGDRLLGGGWIVRASSDF